MPAYWGCCCYIMGCCIMGCCIMGCCIIVCCVIMGCYGDMQYPMFACWFQFGCCCICPRAHISTRVTPSVDGAMLRSAFFGLPPVFTLIVVLVLCPTHCAVHSLLLCRVSWPCIQQYLAVSFILTLSGRFLRLNMLGLLVPYVGWLPPLFLIMLVLPRLLQPLFLSLVLLWCCCGGCCCRCCDVCAALISGCCCFWFIAIACCWICVCWLPMVCWLLE